MRCGSCMIVTDDVQMYCCRDSRCQEWRWAMIMNKFNEQINSCNLQVQKYVLICHKTRLTRDLPRYVFTIYTVQVDNIRKVGYSKSRLLIWNSRRRIFSHISHLHIDPSAI